MFTTAAEFVLNGRTEVFPETVSWPDPGPLISTVVVICGSAPAKVIVWPASPVASMTSLAPPPAVQLLTATFPLAAWIASCRVHPPAEGSAFEFTVMVLALAGLGATSTMAAASSASSANPRLSRNPAILARPV